MYNRKERSKSLEIRMRKEWNWFEDQVYISVDRLLLPGQDQKVDPDGIGQFLIGALHRRVVQ